jgi:small-conductance mechanosensitive channel
MNLIENLFTKNLFSIGDYTLTSGKIFGAACILIFGIALNKLASYSLAAYAKNNSSLKRQGRIQIITTLISYFISTFTLLFILQVFGVNLSIILASSAALLVGVGLGIQGIINNFVSGISLMFGSTVAINDVVKVDNTLGRVRNIGFRTTEIITPLDQSLIIPNSKLIDQTVQNLTHRTTHTGFTIPLTVAYGTNMKQVTKLLIDCANNQSEVLQEPLPRVFCKELGENGIELELRFWVSESFRIEGIKSEIRFRILEEFNNHKIEIPYNQMVVHMQR